MKQFFSKIFLFLILGMLLITGVLVFAEDGWIDSEGIMLDRCHEFAAVAGGVSKMDRHERGSLYAQLDNFTEYRAALTFVDANQLTNPSLAQALALSRCVGVRKNGPTRWEWILSPGHDGPI